MSHVHRHLDLNPHGRFPARICVLSPEAAFACAALGGIDRGGGLPGRVGNL